MNKYPNKQNCRIRDDNKTYDVQDRQTLAFRSLTCSSCHNKLFTQTILGMVI